MSASPPVSALRRPHVAPTSANRTPLWEYIRASGLHAVVMGASKDPNAKVTVLLISPATGLPVLAVKVPTTDRAAAAVEAEAKVLLELFDSGHPGVGEVIPRIVDFIDLDGRTGVVMSAMHGTPMSTLYLSRRHTRRPDQVAADFAALENWLAAFQRASARASAPLDMDGGIGSLLRMRFDGVDGIEGDLERLGQACAVLGRHKVPRTAVHGDLWFGNLLMSQGRISGVVDWEAATISGEPVRDLVRFALMYALYLDCRTRSGRRVPGHRGLVADAWGSGVSYALNGRGWFPHLFRRFVEGGLERLGAPPACWRDAVLAGIAEVAALTDDDAFARRHLELFQRLSREPAGHEASR